MTAALRMVASLDAPAPEKFESTLLDVAPPQLALMEPDGLYVSLNCMELAASGALCDPNPPDLVFQEAVEVDGIRFTTDLGVQCRPLGWQGLTDQFERVVELNESGAVEQSLMALRFTGTEGGSAATDITPAGGAVRPVVGLALLEGYASRHYAGKPVIHASRTIAALLGTQYGFSVQDNIIRTPLGTKVVAGAGYEDNLGPTGAAPAAGEQWVYASGVVRTFASKRLMIDPQLNRTSNEQFLRSQRVWVVDIDCFLAAVRVTIS